MPSHAHSKKLRARMTKKWWFAFKLSLATLALCISVEALAGRRHLYEVEFDCVAILFALWFSLVAFNVAFFLSCRSLAPEIKQFVTSSITELIGDKVKTVTTLRSSGDAKLDSLLQTYCSAQFYSGVYLFLAAIIVALFLVVLIYDASWIIVPATLGALALVLVQRVRDGRRKSQATQPEQHAG